jgi:hypothetical protein
MDLPSFANVIGADAEGLTEFSIYRMEILDQDKSWGELKEPLPDHAGAYIDQDYLYIIGFLENEDIEPELSEVAVENDDLADFETKEINLLKDENWNLTVHILNDCLNYHARISENLEFHKGHIYLDEVLETVEEVEMFPELVTKFYRDIKGKKLYLMVDFKPFLKPAEHDKIHQFTNKPDSSTRMNWVEKVVDELRSAGEIRLCLNGTTINFSEYLKFGEEVSSVDA